MAGVRSVKSDGDLGDRVTAPQHRRPRSASAASSPTPRRPSCAGPFGIVAARALLTPVALRRARPAQQAPLRRPGVGGRSATCPAHSERRRPRGLRPDRAGVRHRVDALGRATRLYPARLGRTAEGSTRTYVVGPGAVAGAEHEGGRALRRPRGHADVRGLRHDRWRGAPPARGPGGGRREPRSFWSTARSRRTPAISGSASTAPRAATRSSRFAEPFDGTEKLFGESKSRPYDRLRRSSAASALHRRC